MIIEKKEISVKNGLHCILRNANSGDAEALLRYLKATAAETRYLLREPEEVTLTVEQEKAYLENINKADRELMLIATVEGEHAGNASLASAGRNARYAHRCSVAIALYRKYCGLGIGRAMLKVLLEFARGCGYEQAELEVAVDNHAAIHLYKSLGFQVYGTLPKNMKYKDGTYADVYWMAKSL